MKSKQVAVRSGWLYTGVPGSEPITNTVVLIDNGHITALVSAEEALPDGYEVLDATDKFVTPGLVNAHEHLEMHRQPGTMQTRYLRSPTEIFMTAVENLLVNLAMGVTTIRDLGAAGNTPAELRDAVANGSFIGPRIYAAVQMIATTGGHGQPLCFEADGVDGMVAAVRTQIKRGADVIKLCASGGVVAAMREDPWAQELSDEEMAAVVTTAHRAGIRVAAHAHPPQAIKAAIRAGVDTIEHGAFMDDECADMMVNNGVYLVPTMDDSFTVVEHGADLGRPPWVVESARASLDYRMKGFARAVEVGVKVAVGSDVAGEMGREMGRMVDGGLSPLEAIVAATHNGAEMLGISDSAGTIEPGKVADIVILDTDPTQDVRAFDHRVSYVLKDGIVHTTESLKSIVSNSTSARNAELVGVPFDEAE